MHIRKKKRFIKNQGFPLDQEEARFVIYASPFSFLLRLNVERCVFITKRGTLMHQQRYTPLAAAIATIQGADTTA